MEQKRMSADERTAHLHIIACMVALGKAEKMLERRLPMVKRGKFWIRGAIKSLRSLSDALDGTVPDNQHESIRRQIQTLQLVVGSKNVPNRNDREYGFWMSYNDLDTVGNALKNCCMFCDKDTQQQRQCPYAKLMDTLPVDKINENSNGCGYFGL